MENPSDVTDLPVVLVVHYGFFLWSFLYIHILKMHVWRLLEKAENTREDHANLTKQVSNASLL